MILRKELQMKNETNWNNEHCSECGEEINKDRIIWLEMSTSHAFAKTQDNQPSNEAINLPKGHDSQGSFPFGSTCAKKVLRTQKCSDRKSVV